MRRGGDSYFAEKKSPERGLKINWSVKTPRHRPSMGVARSGLWAPDVIIFIIYPYYYYYYYYYYIISKIVNAIVISSIIILLF